MGAATLTLAIGAYKRLAPGKLRTLAVAAILLVGFLPTAPSSTRR